ncbi:MFS transporter [Thermosipho melanesiensis]|uniref:Major facilitator superfamily MFS_1 n=2 Tax=Thermosipho melanesiensis TaxID=46541 RepID=A6LL76_THEM4|nr:MFS transporter [Thermosipho melanesiensis]ABR30677.1 major facilitator superfamily MFS_1 [Thermosipho melanesiensis BI429]APT73809.1 MFS transporter [Thermosipho melanesiensis]OOC35748.1 MFS transporter [Thermosipho melanesiensis]OOC39047.1 MFS transporter [Thermosipho melanesiensis]OOC39195.1 MFS transporter [Thermosipho melanesiensis]
MYYVVLNIFFGSLIVNSIAPLMPIFQEEFSLSVSLSSFIPILNTLGNIFFSFAASLIINKSGLRLLNLLSYTFILLALFFLTFFKSLEIVLLSFFLIGAGVTIIFTTSTTILAHFKNPKFGILHAFFGLGGILSPFFVSIFLKNNISYRLLYFIYLLLILILLVWSFFKDFPKISKNIKISTTILKPIFIISIISFLLYSGSEISTVTWASNLFLNFGYSKESASLFLGIFWFLFTLSRFMMEIFLKFFTENTLITFFSISSAILLILTVFLKTPVLFFVFGFFMGSIFPLMQRKANIRLSKDEVGFLNGVTYSATGIGALLFIALMGYVSKYSIPFMFLLPAIGLILVFALQKKEV